MRTRIVQESRTRKVKETWKNTNFVKEEESMLKQWCAFFNLRFLANMFTSRPDRLIDRGKDKLKQPELERT